jgi:hypothetical protein
MRYAVLRAHLSICDKSLCVCVCVCVCVYVERGSRASGVCGGSLLSADWVAVPNAYFCKGDFLPDLFVLIGRIGTTFASGAK